MNQKLSKSVRHKKPIYKLVKIRYKHEDKTNLTSSPHLGVMYYLRRGNRRSGKPDFNPLGNTSETLSVCVPVRGGGASDKGERHIRIISHKLVPPSLPGVEAGEHLYKCKMFYG